jgi:catechol 2,3-dioxygenase-like lactoylglutathione lyase family enzyme
MLGRIVSDMKLTRANVTLMVADLDRSLAFYTQTLGFARRARHGDFFAEALAQGLTLVLHPRRPGATAGAGHLSLGLHAENIDRAAEDLRARDVAIERQENEANRFVFFQDPDGTPLYLIEAKPGNA